MKLYRMRHAQASLNTPSDRERKITEHGADQTKALILKHADKLSDINLVWSSDLIRAKQTAGIVTEILGLYATVITFLSPDGYVKHVLSKQSVDNYQYDHKDMVHFGEMCSQKERRADEATRDVNDWLKCEFMLDKVGNEYEGKITTVTGFGLFVELKNVYVEGLVHVSTLQNDYYQFDAIKHRLIGERTRRSFRLGDTIWVRVVGVDLDDRKVNFESTTAPINADKKSDLGDMPVPARLPRKRGKGTSKEELFKPTR